MIPHDAEIIDFGRERLVRRIGCVGVTIRLAPMDPEDPTRWRGHAGRPVNGQSWAVTGAELDSDVDTEAVIEGVHRWAGALLAQRRQRRLHLAEEARILAILDWGTYAASRVGTFWSAEMVARDLEWWGPARPSIKALSKRWGRSYAEARDLVRAHEGRGA